MKLLHAKQDLENFSNTNLQLLYRYYKIPNINDNDRLWLLTLKLHTQRAQMLSWELHKAIMNNDCKTVKLYLDNGGDPNEQTHDGNTPLHIASQHSNPNCIKLLVDAGANPNIPNNADRTPLHLATAEGCLTCVELLIGAGADINAQSEYGYAPLHIAIERGRIEILKLLLNSGANPKLKYRTNDTPLYAAVYALYPGVGVSPNAEIPRNYREIKAKLQSEIIKLLLLSGTIEGDTSEVYPPLVNNIIQELGGPKEVQKLHYEWLSKRPGRRTKAARK